MFVILSPARNIKPSIPAKTPLSDPLFPKETTAIAGVLSELSPWQLEGLLDVSPERAFEFFDIYQNFESVPDCCALLSYYGAAYRNMAPQLFSQAQLDFAQTSLRILSALYGIVRPLDAIRPHRLGLKRNFFVGDKTLYDFWGDLIYRALFGTREIVVNLASLDYTKLFSRFLTPSDRQIGCRFLLQRPGQNPRGTVSTVRAARGLMARFIIENKIGDPRQLKAFDSDGYSFSAVASNEREYVFVKDFR